MKRRDLPSLPQWGDRVLVLGLGVSGLAAAQLLLARGVEVTAWDQGLEASLAERASLLASQGAETLLAGAEMDDLARFRLVVVSPGIPSSHPLVRRAREQGLPVAGELELGALYCRRPLIAVTGTNGKTTTVTLLGRIFAAGGVAVAVGGNIGIPLCRLVAEPASADLIVVEVSSFQLETILSFRPRLSVFLNFAPDHLDRYPDLESYRRAKLRIFKNQGSGDQAVLPPGTPDWLREAVPAGVKTFSWNEEGSPVFLKGGHILARSAKGDVPVCSVSRLRLAGEHNLANLMAAAAAALAWGMKPETLGPAVEDFAPLAHRLEPVGVWGGVSFFNDSKATNPAAALAALRTFSAPVIWIAGGSDKGFDFSPLADAARDSVKLAILIGATAEKLERALAGVAVSRGASNLQEAVALAWKNAAPGDVILLSPACASFDQFRDYRHRGEVFKESVLNVVKKRESEDE